MATQPSDTDSLRLHALKNCAATISVLSKLLASSPAPERRHLERLQATADRMTKLLCAALETQRRGLGFSLVEVVTMCPTGWFVTPGEGPKFQQDNLLPVFPTGELKRPRDLDV